MSGIKNGSSIGLMKPLSQIKKKFDSTFEKAENDNFQNQINKLGDILGSFNKIMDIKMSQIKNSLSSIVPAESNPQHGLTYDDTQPRFTEIKFPFRNILGEPAQRRLSEIKIFAADLARTIITKGFIWFQENKIPDQKLRQFFCNNFIANVVRYADQNKLTLDELKKMDQHLKDNVFSFLKKRYPQNQSGEPNRKFDSLVVPVDNMISNKNDLVHPSGVKFKYKQSGDYSKEIMQFINYILKVTRQETIKVPVDSKQGSKSGKESSGQSKEKKQTYKQVNLTELFFKEMEDIFKKVENEEWMINAKSGIFQEKQQNKEPAYLQSQKQISQQQKRKLKIEQQVKKQKYKKTVKQYTKYLIGQKISTNFVKFTDKQIEQQNLQVTNSGVMRILTKWCQQLQNCFQQMNINSRDQRFRMVDGTERYIGKKPRRQLFQQLSNQLKQKNTFIKKIKQNIYQNQFKMLQDPDKNLLRAFREFASQDEGIAGYFSTVMKKSYDNYIITYLNKLIHCILQAQQKFKARYIKKQHYKIEVNLITFKIGDLLRCKCSSKEAEIIALYSYLKQYCEREGSNLEIVRVKNRLSEGTKDILINLRFRNKLLVEMQLGINEETSHFIKCSDKTNHFIYELERATFGPIIEICNVYANVDPRAEFFRKKFESLNFGQGKKCEHSITDIKFLPIWCDQCRKFKANLNNIRQHGKCNICHLLRCSGCIVKNGQDEKISTKKVTQKQLAFDELKSQNNKFLRKKIIVRDLQMKKQSYTVIYIVYFNFKCVLFQSLQNKSEKYSVAYIGQAKDQKQLNNLLKNKIIQESIDIIQEKKSENLQEYQNQQKLKKSIYAEIIKVMFKNIKKKYKKYFVFEEIQIEQDKVLVNSKLSQQQQAKNNLPTVEQININNAQLKSLDKLIATFPNVKFALIHKNKIRSLQGVQKWKNIQQLNLEGNRLKAVPQSITQLKNLKFLLLTNNKFTQFPENICGVESLQTLNFKQNKFKVVSKKIKNLKNLRILRLNKNMIEEIPVQISELQKLEQIDMSSNKISRLPIQLKYLKNMKKFVFEGNAISQVPDDMFIDMNSLQQVDLSENKLIKLIPGSFKSKAFLKKMQLSDNKIQVIPEFIFHLPSLQQLILSKNQIKKLTITKDLLSKQKGFIKNLKNLEINQNKDLEQLPQQLFQLTSLEKLKLGSNKYKKKQNIIHNISKLVNLKFIDLQNLELTAFPQQVLKLPKIESIGLDNNLLTQLPHLAQKQRDFLKKINDLYLKNNKFSQFPQLIYSMTSLQNLGLNENLQIKIIQNQKIINLKKLEKLKIQKTGIKKIPEELYRITTLRQLHITKERFSKQDIEKIKYQNSKVKIIDSSQEKQEKARKKREKQLKDAEEEKQDEQEERKLALLQKKSSLNQNQP